MCDDDPRKNDVVRVHDFDRSEHGATYVEGIVVAIEGSFATIVPLRRVRNGQEVLCDDVVVLRVPLNGRSIFDDPYRPRVVKVEP